MQIENLESWLLGLRAAVLLIAFAAFAWALIASRRDMAINFTRLAAQNAQSLLEIRELSDKLVAITAQVHDLSLPSPMISRPVAEAPPPPVSIAASGARGYEMAIRMARGGATIDDIVSSCGTTRAEARLLLRLHSTAGASAA